MAITLSAVIVCSAANPAVAQDSPDKILDRIDSKVFVDGVEGPMSDSLGVKAAALDEPEIQYLVQHATLAVPIMLEHLTKPGKIHYERTRILYFIVFEKAKDPRVLPALADYLDSRPDSEEKNAMNRSPFDYAFWASCAFLDFDAMRHKYKNPAAIFGSRHEIAAQLRAEYKRRSPEH